jgi:hypothetical protein
MMARATLGEGVRSAPFRVARGGFLVSPSPTFPSSPLLIPDGRISRVRLAATAISQRPFPYRTRLKRSLTCPRSLCGYLRCFAARLPVPQFPGLISGCVAAQQPLPTESPFARVRPCLPRLALQAPVSRCYPAVSALTGSCVRPSSSRRLRLSLVLRVLAGCCEPLLHDGPSRRYLCYLPAGAWTPTPAALQVHLPVSSLKTLAFPAVISGRRSATARTATSVRIVLSGLQSFLYVQAPAFARHPGRSHRYARAHGGDGFYFRAPRKSLPPCVPDMLTAQTGQLAVWGLQPHQIAALTAAPLRITTEDVPIVHRSRRRGRPREWTGRRGRKSPDG